MLHQAKARRHRARAIGVVRHVEDPASHALKSPGKPHRMRGRRRVDERNPKWIAGRVKQRQREGEVRRLMPTNERYLDDLLIPEGPQAEPGAARTQRELRRLGLLGDDANRRRACRARIACEIPTHHRIGLTDHRRPSRLEDARLLVSDGLEGIPKVLHVVESDRRHAGGPRLHHVGGVQPAPEPRLDQGDVHSNTSEMGERERRRGFEEGSAEALHGGRPPLDERDDLVRRDGRALHDDALPEVHEVR